MGGYAGRAGRQPGLWDGRQAGREGGRQAASQADREGGREVRRRAGGGNSDSSAGTSYWLGSGRLQFRARGL